LIPPARGSYEIEANNSFVDMIFLGREDFLIFYIIFYLINSKDVLFSYYYLIFLKIYQNNFFKKKFIFDISKLK
jgi:hypothetical protein